jgi:AbrB family looped-hinge helix DNA binding protein
VLENNGRYIFGVCKVGEKGQVVIPKEAREVFSIKAGDSFLVVGDHKKGIALLKVDEITEHLTEVLK